MNSTNFKGAVMPITQTLFSRKFYVLDSTSYKTKMNWNKLFISNLFYILLVLKGSESKIVRKRGVMDNLNDGLKVAGQMFGK